MLSQKSVIGFLVNALAKGSLLHLKDELYQASQHIINKP